MEKLAFAAALGALLPSHLLLTTCDKALVRLLPASCNHVLDIDFLLAPDAIYPHLQCMGSLGRTMYLEFYRFDLLLFPLIYATSLFGVILRVWPSHRIFWTMPLVTAAADILENVSMCFLLLQFPTRYTQVELGVSIFIRLKGVFLAISIAVMVVGLVMKVFSLKPPTVPAAKQNKHE